MVLLNCAHVVVCSQLIAVARHARRQCPVSVTTVILAAEPGRPPSVWRRHRVHKRERPFRSHSRSCRREDQVPKGCRLHYGRETAG